MQQINLIHMISNAGLMVQFVLLLLLFFSITSWSIIIIKYRYIRRAYKESALFADLFWKSRDLANAFRQAKELQGSPTARIFRIGYVELKKSVRPDCRPNRGPILKNRHPSAIDSRGWITSSGRCEEPSIRKQRECPRWCRFWRQPATPRRLSDCLVRYGEL